MEIIGYIGLDVHKETYSACFSYFNGQEVRLAFDAKLGASTEKALSLLFTFLKRFLIYNQIKKKRRKQETLALLVNDF